MTTPAAKLAATQYPIDELLRRRWSGRAIDSRPLPPGTIGSLLEAARWAPSAGNGQPWAFMVFDASDPAARADAEDCLLPMNAWAKRAPLLIMGLAREVRPDGKPATTARHDLGLATENLLLQAFSLGLVAHPMGGFSSEEAKRRFELPEGITPITMITVGYAGDPEHLDESSRAKEQAPRTRKALSEVGYAGRWGRGWTGGG